MDDDIDWAIRHANAMSRYVKNARDRAAENDRPRCKECGMVIGVNCRHHTNTIKDYHPNDLLPDWIFENE